eukprot:gene11575-biopygen3364
MHEVQQIHVPRVPRGCVATPLPGCFDGPVRVTGLAVRIAHAGYLVQRELPPVWEKRQRTRPGRGPDAGRTTEFKETGADRTRAGRGHGRFPLWSPKRCWTTPGPPCAPAGQSQRNHVPGIPGTLGGPAAPARLQRLQRLRGAPTPPSAPGRRGPPRPRSAPSATAAASTARPQRRRRRRRHRLRRLPRGRRGCATAGRRATPAPAPRRPQRHCRGDLWSLVPRGRGFAGTGQLAFIRSAGRGPALLWEIGAPSFQNSAGAHTDIHPHMNTNWPAPAKPYSPGIPGERRGSGGAAQAPKAPGEAVPLRCAGANAMATAKHRDNASGSHVLVRKPCAPRHCKKEVRRRSMLALATTSFNPPKDSSRRSAPITKG